MSESDFKRHFKLSVRAQGGAVFSLSPEHQAGLPDMYVLMPGFMPILVEAKFLKVPVGKTFNKRILYSAYQGRLLTSCWDMQPGSVWGLIGFKTKEDLFYSCLIPGNCDRLTNQIFSDGPI